MRVWFFLLFTVIVSSLPVPETSEESVASAAAATAADDDDPCALPSNDVHFIVVGGGSSGAVIASRLSETPGVQVLLLEAGSDPPEVADIPLRTRDVLMDPKYNWNYFSERQTNCCKAYPNQVLGLPSGKGLGGTSNINSMIYTRGNRYDYDRMKDDGISGWSYEDVLLTFKRMEQYEVLHRREDRAYHGFGGVQTVSTPQYKSPMADMFLLAGEELGYFQVDCNAEYQIGFTPPPVSIKDGVRWGSYHAYLENARNRQNLHIITEALGTKILIDKSKRARGVTYTRGNEECTVKAKREVIVSSGTLRSPQLLMLSGIGPKEELDKFKIPIVKELPGVGQHLKDHVLVSGLTFYLTQPISINFTRLNSTQNNDLWENTHTGPMTSPNGVEGISFFRSRSTEVTQNRDHPTFEISFFSDRGTAKEMFGPDYQKAFVYEDGKDAVTLLPILLQPKSQGEIRLKSNNMADYPIVDPKYMSNPVDEELLLEVVRIALNIGRSKALQKYGAHLIKFDHIPGCDDIEKDTDEFWLCFIRRFSVASYHFVGTCKMTADGDPLGVVDNRLRVFGVNGLRVADVSIMPELPAGHTHAVAMMIGERAAEFIKHDNRL